MSRKQIRHFAGIILDAKDGITEARAVEKVYSDLLGLRIPLTPSNVTMYLRALQREGDFEPLSRVDILSRYLAESLRKPSDVALDSFNSKNKLDVLSAFAFKLYSEQKGEFDERYWLNFCAEYQSRTLSDFPAVEFYHELVESRVFGVYRQGAYFKYSFYFTFFLGRYLGPRLSETTLFLKNHEYMAHSGVVDVITGLSSESTSIVTELTNILETRLNEFATKYVKPTFDPLLSAVWADTDDEEEKIWKPVQKAIAAGPADNKKIDELKTSMLAEARTANQQISFEKFTQLENAIFVESTMLIDALKNADDVDGALKVRAWRASVAASLIVFQVGTIFAPALAKRKRFTWGGMTFVDFNKAALGLEERPHEAIVSVVTALADAAIVKAAREAGSLKLAPVFKALAKPGQMSGFSEVVNFTCLASARGRGWADAAARIIEATDKNAYYLSEMFNQLMVILQYEIMPGKDRESTKRLVALIQTKRNLGKQAPGSKAVNRLMGLMEKDKFFPEPQSGIIPEA